MRRVWYFWLQFWKSVKLWVSKHPIQHWLFTVRMIEYGMPVSRSGIISVPGKVVSENTISCPLLISTRISEDEGYSISSMFPSMKTVGRMETVRFIGGISPGGRVLTGISSGSPYTGARVSRERMKISIRIISRLNLLPQI